MRKALVIIPFYGGERFIKDAVYSVLDQTYPHLRVVVVDDNSAVSAAAALTKIRDHRLSIIRRDHQGGTGAARNTGLRLAARDDVVAYLDQDDFWPADLLECYVDEVSPGIAVAYDSVEVGGETPGRSVFAAAGWPERRTLTLSTIDLALRGMPMPKVLVTGEDAHAVGGHREWAYGVEDFDFIIRLLLKGIEVHFASDARGYWRRHDAQVTSQIARRATSDRSHRIRATHSLASIYRSIEQDGRLRPATRELCVRLQAEYETEWAMNCLIARMRRESGAKQLAHGRAIFRTLTSHPTGVIRAMLARSRRSARGILSEHSRRGRRSESRRRRRKSP